jgi:glycosyltransferase involved in cell wall biosynthesis
MRISINSHYLHRSRLSGLGRYAREIAAALADHSLAEVRLPDFFYDGGTLRRWLRFIALAFLELLAPALLVATGRARWHISPAFSVPLSLFCRRHIVVVHDLAFREYPNCYSRRERFYYNVNLLLLRLGRHRVVTPSHYVRDRLVAMAGIAPQRITVISPYGEITPPQQAKKEKSFLLLSNAHPRKNIAATVEGFTASQAPARGYALAVAGNFEHPPETGLPVHFHHALSESQLAQAYAGAEALLLFSLSEGFGFPVVEAAQCGTPALTSECTSLAELIDPDRPPMPATTAAEIRDRINRYLGDSAFRAALARDKSYVTRAFTRERFDGQWRRLLDVG